MFEGVIKDYVYPRIKDLRVKWVENESQSGLGVLSIFIPPQDEDQKPFVITKIYRDGSRIQEIVIGIARRIGASSEPLTPKELQRFIRQGSNSFSNRLAEINEKLDVIVEKLERPLQPAPADDIETRIKNIYDA